MNPSPLGRASMPPNPFAGITRFYAPANNRWEGLAIEPTEGGARAAPQRRDQLPPHRVGTWRRRAACVVDFLSDLEARSGAALP